MQSCNLILADQKGAPLNAIAPYGLSFPGRSIGISTQLEANCVKRPPSSQKIVRIKFAQFAEFFQESVGHTKFQNMGFLLQRFEQVRGFQRNRSNPEHVPKAPAADPPDGFMPISKLIENDVFIVGYPKSGNTWFQNLAAAVVWGLIPEYAPPKLAQTDLVPDVHATRFYKRYATPMYFKSHHLPRQDYRRVVYLLRDGRDVMVSYYHFLRNTRQEVDFLEMVRNGRGLFPCKWHEHVEAWLANPYGAEMLVIRYQDLKTDAVSELSRFCAFVGIDRSREFLEMMAQSASFPKMRHREEAMGRSGVIDRWIEGRYFARRGEVGSHKDEMPAEVLDAFLEDARSTLQRTRYLGAAD